MSTWIVPKVWLDGECWIIGGGPSMPRQFGVPEDVIQAVMTRRRMPDAYSPYLAALHGRHVVGVNNAYQIGDWLDAMFFGDCGWYVAHRNALARWAKLKVTCCNRFAAKAESKSEGIKYLAKDTNHRLGISPNPSMVSWNSNSGAAAISLATHFGVKRIILLGFDMKLDDRHVSHWHGCHGDPRSRPPGARKPPPFQRHLKGFPVIAEDAKAMGVEILNASPDSAMDCFRKVVAKELL